MNCLCPSHSVGVKIEVSEHAQPLVEVSRSQSRWSEFQNVAERMSESESAVRVGTEQ